MFAIALAVTFAVWYASERTLSIHTIFTTRREAFYWLAILFTFALGTAAGDLVAEQFGLGYGKSALIFGGADRASVAVAHYRFGLNAIVAFWVAYILTRPLGASIGDFLSRPRRRRPRPGHHRHQRDLPGHDPRARRLPDHHPKGRDAADRCLRIHAKVSVTRAPPCGRLPAVARPPWASAIAAAIAIPRPVPSSSSGTR